MVVIEKINLLDEYVWGLMVKRDLCGLDHTIHQEMCFSV